MYKNIVQDYIRAAIEQDRNTFLRRLEVPVLVWEAPQAGGLFSWGSTRQTEENKSAPAAKDVLQRGHQLPVFEVRQRTAGRPGEIFIGRSSQNDLVIQDDTVSSQHAVFQRNDRTGSFTIQDQSSTNGTRVNGTSMVAGRSIVLFDGDMLALGDSLFLFFYPAGLYAILRTMA